MQNETINRRIRKVRKALDLTQQAFADRIGISRGNIATYETREGSPGNSVIVLICREFNVNETWLRTGEGDMFVKTPNTALEELSVDFYLDSFDEALVDEYIHLTQNQRKTFRGFFYRVLKKSVGDSVPEDLLEVETGYPTPEGVDVGEEAVPGPEKNVVYITSWFPTPMSAGTGQPAGSEEPEELDLTKRPPRGTSYVAPVSGDSMEPTYHDGDKLFIRVCEEIQIGQVGVFFMDGRQWVKELGDSVLISHNPRYDPIPMREDIHCQGLVLGVCDESYFE